jgi:hypothetical protein
MMVEEFVMPRVCVIKKRLFVESAWWSVHSEFTGATGGLPTRVSALLVKPAVAPNL